MHHISALIADPNTYKITDRLATTNGCYKASISKNGSAWASGKDFFPDDWDENKVVDAIKGAFNNPDPGFTNNMIPFYGTHQGIKIKIVRQGPNGPIKTAFPQ